MTAILKRELKAYFQTVIGWLFAAAVLALYGLYFYAYNLRAGYPYISYSVSAMAFILLLAVPVLTMRSLAEERHSKTDQLMLTAPVSLGKLILGKYLAMAAVFTSAVAVISLTPLILSIFGTVPLLESYVAILGFWLYGLASIAIGLFLSSLTESQVIAAVLTFGVLFLGYMMGSITGMISQSGNLLTSILNAYDLYEPLQSFMNGSLDLTSVVYYLSIIALCLFLSCQSIQKRRFSMSTKKLVTGAFSVGMIIAACAVTVGANLLVRELPSTLTAVDATSTKLYSITDTTKDFLKGLSHDVTIYVLAAEKNADATLAETLKKYEDLSDHVKVEYKSPTVYPAFYSQYTETAPSANSVIIAGDRRSKVVDYNDIYEYSYDYTNYSRSLEGYDAEGQITSAIEYVTLDTAELPVLYEIEGHGETALAGAFKEAVEKANVTMESLTLLKEEQIPEDASAILINGPVSDFSKEDADKVKEYLKNGGKAIINTYYENKGLANFESILSAYGVERVDGIVMENDSSYFYNNVPYYLLPNVESSNYTASVNGKYVFAPYSEAFTHPEESEEIGYTPLLTTTDKAVSKVDASNADTSELEENDIAGPFTISLAVEKTEGDKTTQLIVTGSPVFFTDHANLTVSGGNASMFSDILSGLVKNKELSSNVIPVKDYKLGTITVTSFGVVITGLAAAVLIPLALLGIGIILWAVRRKK